ncbi:MAG TPA: response regulator [Steroidobacteraceae bacterium]
MRDTENTTWRRFSDQAQRTVDSRSPHGGQEPSVQVNEAQPSDTRESEGGVSALSAAPTRILIIDSDISSSDSLEIMLHASGYLHTRVAYSGHAGLAIAALFRPDVVLLELTLLDMSGYEVARLLRERAQSYDLRLIALTSGHEHAGRELARAAGFERYLLKPVAAGDLSELLQMEAINRPCRRDERAPAVSNGLDESGQ